MMEQSLIFEMLVASDKYIKESDLRSLDEQSQKLIKKLRKVIDSKLNNFPGAFRSALDHDDLCLIN
jgi:hypothetical protein